MIKEFLSIKEEKSVLADVSNYYSVDENDYVTALLDYLPYDDKQLHEQKKQVTNLIEKIRKDTGGGSGIDAFLQEYSLDTEEGIILMSLAESLMRIPDGKTADALIEDKLAGANWEKHLKKSDSLFVNASTWGLMLTGKITGLGREVEDKPNKAFGRLVDKLGEPVIRSAMNQAMKIMGKQFVLGRNINEALKEADTNRKKGYTHSFDMLGEAALTQADAKIYFDSYLNAIKSLGAKTYKGDAPRPTISIKLSALHPRYEEMQRERVLTELFSSVCELIKVARSLDIGITIDAEEMDRLELSLDLFEKLYLSEEAKDWGNLGLVVQAYSKRALIVLHWLNCLAEKHGSLIPVRLVKGAYWDTEVKLSQQQGLIDYPVFTRKVNTDVSYIACAYYLLKEAVGNIFPQFATHNAQTVVSIFHYAGANKQFEFQRLHGMGQELYDEVMARYQGTSVRIYAPVGAHKDLLPYLVRRLLENGANTSFVHKLVDPSTPVEQLSSHPINDVKLNKTFANSLIKKPRDIFPERENAHGTNLNIRSEREPFLAGLDKFKADKLHAATLINGQDQKSAEVKDVCSPFDHSNVIGTVAMADVETAKKAITEAKASWQAWSKKSVDYRADILHKIADSLEENKHELIALCALEAGRSLQDGIDEIREAVDFCRYYAENARSQWGKDLHMPGPTGETNLLKITGRGVFFCVSPWNFPIAIFTGQIVAALVAGNAVIAKPADQTNLVAYKTMKLMHKAGVPENVLHLLCGRGSVAGQAIIEDERIDGICFTGSTETAKHVNRTIANREGSIIPFIAETGGQNAMIVDSTSLPEQVILDVVQSSFTSAGQRCSALRVLFVQEDIADKVVELLQGAMDELNIGNPEFYATDVGPVIDAKAKAALDEHVENISKGNKVLAQAFVDSKISDKGTFVTPIAIELKSISELKKEHFGPILHVIRFKNNEIEKVIESINATGYGLTFGIHSRNETFYNKVASKIDAGNIYINRNQIGAVVGVNPFGGHGLSGTGPKAGGPHYLARFINEKTISNNITAIGGNATLLALGGEE